METNGIVLIMGIFTVQFTTTEIPKGSPLWQGVQGNRVPRFKFTSLLRYLSLLGSTGEVRIRIFGSFSRV